MSNNPLNLPSIFFSSEDSGLDLSQKPYTEIRDGWLFLGPCPGAPLGAILPYNQKIFKFMKEDSK